MGGRRQSLTRAFAVPLRMKKTSKAIDKKAAVLTPITEDESRNVLRDKVENDARFGAGSEYDVLI